MKITCHKIKHLMGLYILDELERDDRKMVETHTQSCSTCSTALAQYRSAHQIISTHSRPAPSPDWDRTWQVIQKRLLDQQHQQERKRRYIPVLKWAGALASATAIFLLGLVVGVQVLNNPARDQQTVADAGASAFFVHEFQEHVENIKPVILQYANYWSGAGKPADLPVGKERVINLLIENQLLLCRLPIDSNQYVQQLLNELNLILAKIAILTLDDPESLALVKKMIRKKGLLFKMEALRPTMETETSL